MRRAPLRMSLAFALLATAYCAVAGEPPAELAEFDLAIKSTDRAHWAFQPLRSVVPPAVRDVGWPRNPIDSFVLAKLESLDWKPSPQAESHALLRRVYLDLIGMPPTLAEQQAFLDDGSPDALDRVIEELLARPAYGERWGRHWLDLVRYAETNGYERDATKPFVWRYRDYVIRSFNDDKPYDRFIREQLAGDELEDSNAETLIATGFNRLGHWDDEPADPKEDRFDQLDDIVSTAGQVFLGLTVGCARCHNHKFEPLTMHDYYRLVAIFDPLERPRNGRTELDLPLGTLREIEALQNRDQQIDALERQMAQERAPFWTEVLDSGRSQLPRGVQTALRTDEGKRTDEQKRLVREHAKQIAEEVAAVMPEETRSRVSRLEQQIAELRTRVTDLPRGYFMHEPAGRVPITHLLIRGKASRPGPMVNPGLPAVLVESQPSFSTGSKTTRRRLTIAEWITESERGSALAARVIVNRVWQFHFGEGIVRTPSDFGLAGQPPTHPELLEWLAHEFVRGGWSIKNLHRLIMTSNTYRMSKRWHAAYAADDPENERLWRMHFRRLEVEAIRDSMLSVSGQMNRQMYGPSMYPHVPKEALEGHSDPDKIWKPFDERDASRRTVYAFVKRSMVVPMLEVLDFCDTTRSSASRAVTTVAPQALTLFNSDFVNRQAAHLARRLVDEVGDDSALQIERAYQLAVCRRPTPRELATMLAFIERESKHPDEGEHVEPERTSESAQSRALEQICRTILNLNEFVYAD